MLYSVSIKAKAVNNLLHLHFTYVVGNVPQFYGGKTLFPVILISCISKGFYPLVLLL